MSFSVFARFEVGLNVVLYLARIKLFLRFPLLFKMTRNKILKYCNTYSNSYEFSNQSQVNLSSFSTIDRRGINVQNYSAF